MIACLITVCSSDLISHKETIRSIELLFLVCVYKYIFGVDIISQTGEVLLFVHRFIKCCGFANITVLL